MAEAAVLVLAAGLLYLLCQRYDPQRPHARVLRAGVRGVALLLLWNLLPLPPASFNPLSAMIAASLGFPGAALVAALNLLP